MRITNLEAYTVALPFRAPIMSAFGISYPARVRTFIRLHTDAGLIGHGETGINPLRHFNRDAQRSRFENTIRPAVVGESPYDHGWIRRKLFYEPDVIAIEIACWDIITQAAGVPLYRLLGGVGDCLQVPVAGYCFFRAPAQDGSGAVTLENFADHCQQIQHEGGFKVLKLKLGAHHPNEEIPVVQQVREAVGDNIELRIDPNGCWSLGTALRTLNRLESVNLEYAEEPVRSLGPADGTTATHNLRRLRVSSRTPIAADHCYRMDLLTQIIRDDAADIVLADLYGCGGIAETLQYCRTASAFGLGVALHSGAESDIGQVAKLHIHAALHHDMQYAGDAIYPEYVDSVLVGGKLAITDGMMTVPQSPGLGVQFDDDRLARWALTEARHRELNEFWDERKADFGIGYPGSDLLVRHF
jgi:glucarate dehydratase